jgi:putative hemolysin
MEISIEILMILLLILLNGILAMAEFAVVAARKTRLQQRAKRGDQRAQAALELAKNPADFLSTVQIGITLVGVLAGAFGGATVAEELEEYLNRVSILALYSEGIAVGVVVVSITALSIVFGELVPKRLALNNPERTAAFLAVPMSHLSKAASPLVSLFSNLTGLVLKILKVRRSEEPPVTEEEIRFLIAQASRAGEILQSEEELLARVFRLGDRRAGALITPRTEIEWLDLEDPLDVNLNRISSSTHSCFPVGHGNLDNLLGVVVAKDLLRCHLAGELADLKACLVPPVFIPEKTPALAVLELFKATEPHLVIVIDEYGGVQGLLTIRDILEAIVGDFQVKGRQEVGQIFRREDGSWLVDGMLPVDEFMEAFQVSGMPDHNRGYYETIGGFAMSQLGKIPATGDNFEWGGLRFEIMDMDGLRVDKVLVNKTEAIPRSTDNP